MVYYKKEYVRLGFCMKKVFKDKAVDIDFLNLFKRSLAISFSLFIFGVQSSYANNITPGGGMGTIIEGGNTNNSTITGGIINDGTGFHHFGDFQIDANGIANLIFGSGANRYVNMVNNQVLINGIFNAMKDGKIGGNVIFVSPMGMIVGASGVMNVGSLQTITPAQNAYDSLIGLGNSINYSNITSLSSNSDKSSTRIDGKIFALNDINLNDGKSLTISPTANIIAGFNENGFARTQVAGFNMSEIVNDKGVVDSAYMTDGAGSIKIVSADIKSGGVGGLIQSSGGVDIDTTANGTISLGAKVLAKGDVNIGNASAETGTGSLTLNNDITADGGNVNLKAVSTILQGSGTNITAIEKTGDTNTGKFYSKSFSLSANGNITADNGIDINPTTMMSQGNNSEIKNNKTGEIKIETGIANLDKITNLGGDINITSGNMTLKDTISTEKGNINIGSIMGGIQQANDKFNAFETKNNGKLTITVYDDSSLGSAAQSLNVKVEGDVNVTGSGGSAYLKSKDSNLTLGSMSNLATISAQSGKHLKINNSLQADGAITLKANEGVSQSAGSSITSLGEGDISITNTDIKDADGNVTKASTGAISVGQITNHDGGVTITNEAAGELLTVDKTLTATGDINLTSNAGITQTADSLITTNTGNINLTNKNEGSMNLNEISTNGGGINLINSAENGNIVLNKNITGAKDINISAKNGISQGTNSTITLNGSPEHNVTINNTGKGDVTINKINNNGGSVTIKNLLGEGVSADLAGDLTINGDVNANSGFVDIKTNGNFTQNGEITAGGVNAGTTHSVDIVADKNALLKKITGTGSINIKANDVLLKDLVQANGGSIDITSVNHIKQQGAGKILHADSNINLIAKNGSIGETGSYLNLNSGGTVALEGDNIYVNSPDADINFGVVTGKNEVSLKTTNTSAPPIPGGKITLSDTVSGAKVTIDSAKNLELHSALNSKNGVKISTKTGILSGNNANITNTESGNIDITNNGSGAMTLAYLTNNNGNINISHTSTDGTMTLTRDITAAGGVKIDSNQGINQIDRSTISSTTAGDIDIKNTNTGKISLNVINQKSGNINVKNEGGGIDINGLITNLEGNVSLVAKNDIFQNFMLGRGLDVKGNISLISEAGKIGTVDKFISMTNTGDIFASATNTDNGSVYLRTIGNSLTFDATKILFGKDIGLSSDNTVILNNDLNALNGSIYIDSGQALTLLHNLNALHNVDITATGGINQTTASNITTNDTGYVSIKNNDKGSINVNNITSGGTVRIKNDNIATDVNGKVNINGNVTAKNDITMSANNGFVQSAASTITSEEAGDITITNNLKNDINLNNIINNNGNVSITNKANSNTLLNNLISAKDGGISINNVGNIVQNNANALLKTNKDVNLVSTSASVGSDAANKYINIQADGTVSGSVAGSAYLESRNYNLNTGTLYVGTSIKAQTIGTGDIITKGVFAGPNITLTAADNILSEYDGSGIFTSTGNINLTAINGSIGSLAKSFGLSSGGSIIASASNGDIYINSIDRNANFGNVTAGGDIALSSTGTAGQITINNALSGKGNVTIDSVSNILLNQNVTGTNDVTLNAKTGITQTAATILSTAGNVAINNTTSGNVSLKNVTAQNGNITIDSESSTGSTSLGGLLKAQGTGDKGKIAIKSGGNLTQTTAGVSIDAQNTIDLLSKNGSIGTNAANGIRVKTPEKLSAEAKNNIYIESPNSNLTLGSIKAGLEANIKTTGTNGTLTTTEEINGATVVLSSVKDLIIGNNINSEGAITLGANSGIIQNDGTILSRGAGKISISNAQEGDVSLKTVKNENGEISIVNSALGRDVILNSIITSDNASIAIEADRHIVQSTDNDQVAIVANKDVSLIAHNGDVGFAKTLLINADGKVSAQANNVYLASPDKNLNISNITALNNVVIGTTGTLGDVKIYGLVKGSDVEINAINNILQDAGTAKSIDSTGEVRLNATNGNIGEMNNSMDLTAGTNVSASAAQGSVYLNGVDSNLNTSLITAKNDIDLSTTGNGRIFVTNDLTTNSGYISLNSAKDLEIRNNIWASSDVTLKAQEGINQTGGTVKSTGNGKVAITNETSGNISLKEVSSNGGNISVENKAVGGNVTLNSLVETNNGASISVKSEGNITQTTDDVTLRTDGEISLTTTSGNIGLLDKFIKLFTGSKVNAQSGDSLYIESPNNNLKTGIVTAKNDVNIKTTGTGKLTVSNAMSSQNGNVTLTSADNIELDDVITTTKGDINLNATKNIIQTKTPMGVTLNSGKNISLNSATGNIGGAESILLSAKGSIAADAANGAVNLTGVNSDIKTDKINAGTNIDLSTEGTGNIIVTNDMRTNNGHIKLNSANNLELQKNITASGDVTLTAKSGITQSEGTISSSGVGNILIQNTGSNDVSLKTVSANGGNINVINSAAGGNISLNDVITTNTAGNISIKADNNITQDPDIAIVSLNSAGDLQLTALNGSIGQTGNAIDISASGNLGATAQHGAIVINGVNRDINTNSILAGTNIDLSTEGTGKIIVSNDLSTTNGYIRLNSAKDLDLKNNISATDDVILIAKDGITQISGEIKSTGTGDVTITNSTTGDVSLKNVSSNSGNIDITNNATDASGGNVVLNNLVESKNGGKITINAEKNISQTSNVVSLKTDGDISLNAKNGKVGLLGKFLQIFSKGTVDAKGDDIYLESPDNDLTTGTITAKNDVQLKTTGTKGSITTKENITGKDIVINAVDNITVNKNVTAQTSLAMTAQKGLEQKQNSVISTNSGALNLTANNGNVNLNGTISNTTGRVTVTNNTTGNSVLGVHNLIAGNGFDITHKGNGILSIDGTVNNNSGTSTINAQNTGSESGVVTTGIINNKGVLNIDSHGQKGTKLGGKINNNLISEAGGAHSDVTVHNYNGALNITAEILNGTDKNSQNQINLINDGAGGLNYQENAIIDNHGLLTLENNQGNMSLWGTIKARLKSSNTFRNNGVVGSADDDVRIGLKLENWGNEITYENTGAGSLIIDEKAVLSNFSVQDEDGTHTGILNLKNSGAAGSAGGGIEINGTINNGIISDGTIVGNDNRLIAAGEIVSGGIVNIENNGTGVNGTDTSSQRQGDFGIEINSSAKINNFAEMNITNKNENSLGKIKIDGTITGGKGTILTEVGVPIPTGNVINITNSAKGADSGIEFGGSANVDVKGNNLNIANAGKAGIKFNSGSKVKTDANLAITNSGTGGINFDGADVNALGTLNLANTLGGISFTNNSKVASVGKLTLTNQNGNIDIANSNLSSDADLSIDNKGSGALNIKTGSNIKSKSNLTIKNTATGGINVDGVVHGKNLTVTNSNSDLNIAHNNAGGNLIADNDININVTDGNILNHSTDGTTIANGTGLQSGNDIYMNVINGNIGVLDSTLNNIINDGFNLNPNNSIQVNAGGKINASSNDLNLKSSNTDMNIGTITANNALLTVVNGNIKALDGSNISTNNNLYLLAQGNGSAINISNLTTGGKLTAESDADTTIKSPNGLNIDSMLSKNGSINIEADGNTDVNEIAAKNDITIKVNDEKLNIVNLGRVERDKNIIPKTVHLTVNDAKNSPSGDYNKGMTPEELAALSPNGKLDILNGYVRDKVTIKADTVNAGVYDLTSDIPGTKRPGATGFHNANLDGKLLEFDVQGANYAQSDVSGISNNWNYVPDANDKHALNVYITLGDSVGDARYGANFKKLYSDYAFIDSINSTNPSAFSHIIIESGIIGEKAIIRNNLLRLDIDNTTTPHDSAINKHYNDSPTETISRNGSFNMEMYDKIVIDRDPPPPIDPSKLKDYNPHRINPEYDLDEEITPVSAKNKKNKAVKDEDSTAYKQIKWIVRNKNNDIIGSCEKIQDPIIKDVLGISKNGLLVSSTPELKKNEIVHINMSYKEIPFSVDGKVENNRKGISEISFQNADKLTSTILLFLSMYKENL